MKYIVIILSLFLLTGCVSSENKSDDTHIVLKEDADILLEETSITMTEGMTVDEVISMIESMDGSKQTYTGVTNSKQIKTKDVFYQYEFLLVTSESGKYRQYYQILFFN